jgi:hypothetical protein
MPYTFTHTRVGQTYSSGQFDHTTPSVQITYEIKEDEVTVDTLLTEFQCFVKACGFYVDNGQFEFVENDDGPLSDPSEMFAGMGYNEPETMTRDPFVSSQMEFDFGPSESEEEQKGPDNV